MDRFVTRSFIRLSLAVGLFGGFGLGTTAFALATLGVPVGRAWPALAQAHGHAQLFGFSGLMVLGVALVFLPRLRGTPLASAGLVPWVLGLYGGGLLLRVVTQGAAPLLEPAGQERLVPLVSFGLPLGGVLEVGGVALALGMLVRTALGGPPLAQRAGVMQVLPLLVTAWVGFVVALVVHVVGAWTAWSAWALPWAGIEVVGRDPWLVPPAHDALVVKVALLGWLVPMSLAFAARNFPLFLATRPPSRRGLAVGLALLVAGMAIEIGAGLLDGGGEMGLALQGGALLWLTVVIGALGPKARVPGRERDARDTERAAIAGVALTDAFAWLAATGALMIARAALPTVGIAPPPEDAWRHALGAGFVLLLITGMALRLIPGFGGSGRETDLRAARVAVRAAQAAALLRVAPQLALWLLSTLGLDTDPGPIASWLGSAAGIAGAVAVGALWLALRRALRRPVQGAGSEPS